MDEGAGGHLNNRFDRHVRRRGEIAARQRTHQQPMVAVMFDSAEHRGAGDALGAEPDQARRLTGQLRQRLGGLGFHE
jgi:phage terminase small subunit